MNLKEEKYKAYIYPVTSRNNSGVYNPYMDNFISSTGRFINYLNKEHPSNKGIFNLFRFISRIDYLFLNWIEDLPEKKGGILQAFVFLGLIRIFKLLHIKVIWTLHNKVSHSANNLFLKNRLFKSLLKRSDVIITHSAEGIKFAESLHPGITSRIFYFPHPIVPAKSNHGDVIYDKRYDILIWGSLAPYKAIDIFLEYLLENNLMTTYRILIAGKAVSSEFLRTMQNYENENIIIRNQFIENEELNALIRQSKVVLFTYDGNSVLSSGALIDSISHGGMVVGPNIGAFAEMGSAGIIRTYEDLDDLKLLLEQIDQFENSMISEKRADFISSHTWSKFSKAFEKFLMSADASQIG